MAEKSRKKEHFELEGMAMMAITTSNSMRVKCFFIFVTPLIHTFN